MKNYALLIGISMLFTSSCIQKSTESSSFPELSGPYFGQTPPDSVPEIFAPGIVSTGLFTRDMAISPDGKEIFFCISIGNYNYAKMLYSKEINDKWTQPEIVPFTSNAKTIDFEPAFSPDGNRLYFLSARPDGDEEAGDQDIWYVERTEDGWSEAINPGEPLNTPGGEFFPSLTNDNYLYFSRRPEGARVEKIYRSKIYLDSIGTPEVLPEQINSGTTQFNAFVSQNHDYIIVPVAGRQDAYSGVDYYISFRNEKDQWSEPQNLGAHVNEGNTRGWSAYVSPDGKYLFYMSNKSEDIPADELSYDRLLEANSQPGNGNACIYWVSTDFIDKLKEAAVFGL